MMHLYTKIANIRHKKKTFIGLKLFLNTTAMGYSLNLVQLLQ